MTGRRSETGDVEITEEMVEAGYQELIASGITSDPLEADRLVVVEIYRAMISRHPRLVSA